MPLPLGKLNERSEKGQNQRTWREMEETEKYCFLFYTIGTRHLRTSPQKNQWEVLFSGFLYLVYGFHCFPPPQLTFLFVSLSSWAISLALWFIRLVFRSGIIFLGIEIQNFREWSKMSLPIPFSATLVSQGLILYGLFSWLAEESHTNHTLLLTT